MSEQTTDIEYAQDLLQVYLEVMWGYRFSIHHGLVFEGATEIDGIEVYGFNVYSTDGELSNTFAISVSEERVFVLNEDWVD